MGSPEEKELMRKLKWNNGSFAHIQRGSYDINGREMYFRSKWEANTCLYLDWLKKQGEIIDWEYEPKPFDFPTRTNNRYVPDFIVTTKKGLECWEVKGYYTKKDKTKMKRFAQYYPEYKIIMVEKEFYNDIKKKVGKMLRFF